MNWHKSYQKQARECKRTGNQFVVQDPWNSCSVIVCVPFKSYCCSKNCFAKRQEETGKSNIVKAEQILKQAQDDFEQAHRNLANAEKIAGY